MRTSVLTVTMMALLLTAVMPAATQSFVVPDAPDLLIKTRRTYARTSPETSFTDVLYIKGAVSATRRSTRCIEAGSSLHNAMNGAPWS